MASLVDVSSGGKRSSSWKFVRAIVTAGSVRCVCGRGADCRDSNKEFSQVLTQTRKWEEKSELRAFQVNLRFFLKKNWKQLCAAPGEDKAGKEGSAAGEISMNAT